MSRFSLLSNAHLRGCARLRWPEVPLGEIIAAPGDMDANAAWDQLGGCRRGGIDLSFVRVADDLPERPVDTRAPFERGFGGKRLGLACWL